MSSKRRKPITVAELLKGLESDFEYVRRRREQQAREAENEAEYLAAARPVIDALDKVGFRVRYVSDLVTSRRPYPDAVPILLNWLPRIQNDAVKDDIVRTLSVPWARTLALRPLLDELKSDPGGPLTGALANAVEILADHSVCEELKQLAHDRRLGDSRGFLVLSLAKCRPEAASGTLTDLLEDPPVRWAAIRALGRLKAETAYSALKEFTTHSDAAVRREAIRAVAKIERARTATKQKRHPRDTA